MDKIKDGTDGTSITSGMILYIKQMTAQIRRRSLMVGNDDRLRSHKYTDSQIDETHRPSRYGNLQG